MSDSTAPSAEPSSANPLPGWVAIAFFLSGFAALIYQVCWQRALFSVFGINIESTTTVVTAFMVGLGFGGLAGGRLSLQSRFRPIVLFGAAELVIGLFGWFSLDLIDLVAASVLPVNAWLTGGLTFGLVLVPTLLMGATLPLLVTDAVSRQASVGAAVGGLYFVNTLGAAFAALLTAVVLLGTLGLAGAVRAAASINFAVGALALVRAGRRP